MLTNPWDALGVLEDHASEPFFVDHWRAFLRACAFLFLPHLPFEVREWVAAADEFEQGRLKAEGLTEVRVRAWKFHDARRESSSPSELSALRVAMYRLWPTHEASRWHESAWHFLNFCEGAGLQEEQWWSLLQEHFSDVLGQAEDN